MPFLDSPCDRSETSLVACRLPEGAKLHGEFGIFRYGDLETLRDRFAPGKFENLGDRSLEIVSTASIGVQYDNRANSSRFRDVEAGYNVVISYPLDASSIELTADWLS